MYFSSRYNLESCNDLQLSHVAQLAGAVEYTDCFWAEE